MKTHFRTTFLLTACFFSSVTVFARADDSPAPIVIREQGSMIVGGTTTAVPGKFDPRISGIPKGRKLMATTPMHSTRFRWRRNNCLSFSCTAGGNRVKRGKRRPTGGKDSRTSFYAADSDAISSISPAGEEPERHCNPKRSNRCAWTRCSSHSFASAIFPGRNSPKILQARSN